MPLFKSNESTLIELLFVLVIMRVWMRKFTSWPQRAKLLLEVVKLSRSVYSRPLAA